MNNPSRLSLAAQSYAQRGWYVFPCKAGRKEPATRSGLRAATDDVPSVRRYWGQADWNIGIHAGRSELVIIDLDLHGLILTRERSVEETPGIITWQRMLDHFNGGRWVETYTVVTAGNGLHLYFAQPAGLDAGPSSVELGLGVDVRAGESYVIAPPSVAEGPPFVDANKPRWEQSLYELVDDREPAVMPAWLVDMVRKPPVDEDALLQRFLRSQRTWQAGDKERTQLVDRWVARIRNAPAGGRNETLNGVAYWAFWIAGDQPDLRYILHEAGLSIGLSEAEVDKTLRSAARAAGRM